MDRADLPAEPIERIEPALPMLRIEPALPMLRIEPALPMLRIDPTLPMLSTDRALNRLPALNRLYVLWMLVSPRSLGRSRMRRRLRPTAARRAIIASV